MIIIPTPDVESLRPQTNDERRGCFAQQWYSLGFHHKEPRGAVPEMVSTEACSMSETMTLEKLRNVLREEFMIRDAADVDACIDAAIRERDELRKALADANAQMAESSCFDVELESARTHVQELAAELAALKKRIEEAPQGFGFLDPEWGCPIVRAGVADTAIGKRVRLLVEDDDV